MGEVGWVLWVICSLLSGPGGTGGTAGEGLQGRDCGEGLPGRDCRLIPFFLSCLIHSCGFSYGHGHASASSSPPCTPGSLGELLTKVDGGPVPDLLNQNVEDGPGAQNWLPPLVQSGLGTTESPSGHMFFQLPPVLQAPHLPLLVSS